MTVNTNQDVQKALNTLLGVTPRFADRAQAISCGTMATFNMGGVNQFGERFGLHLLDPLGGGSGAFASHDGISAGGPVAAVCPLRLLPSTPSAPA